MNKNQKERKARIDLRLTPSEKERIERLAKRCGLSRTQYLIQRALGYEPKTVLPDAFFDFYQKLCQAANELDGTEAESRYLALAQEIQRELILPGKEDVRRWRPQASGPSREGSPT